MARLIFADKRNGPARRISAVDYTKGWRSVRLSLEPLNKNWWEDPDVSIAFTLPRVSAALERLMGSNVVRLTDRFYMNALYERIDERYREQLNKRIRAREIKEVERQRQLIIDGKTKIIPEELRNDPTFTVNRLFNKRVKKIRFNLKTTREKNAEQMRIRSAKWEREHMLHEEEERKRLEILAQRRRERKELQQRFRNEDAEIGLDLLRIHDQNWRPCEMDLKEFLESERAKMKARGKMIPTSFSSDPLDMKNVLRAKQKEREAKRRLRAKLLEQAKREKTKRLPVCEKKPTLSVALPDESYASTLAISHRDSLDSSRRKLLERDSLDGECEEISDSSTQVEETADEASTVSESKRRYAEELDEDMQADEAKGLLATQDQYEHLRYRDDKIFALRHARDIRELHKLTEEIILGDRIEEEEEEEEEVEEEEEQAEEESDSSSYSL